MLQECFLYLVDWPASNKKGAILFSAVGNKQGDLIHDEYLLACSIGTSIKKSCHSNNIWFISITVNSFWNPFIWLSFNPKIWLNCFIFNWLLCILTELTIIYSKPISDNRTCFWSYLGRTIVDKYIHTPTQRHIGTGGRVYVLRK